MVNEYNCVCDAGFEGLNCDVNIDDCVNVTCPSNHSYCIDLIDNSKCQCLEGYMGENCTEQIDKCQEHTCLNNGTCIQLAQGYKCLCVNNWNGTHCNESSDICVNIPCNPLGSSDCLLNNGSYECICMTGWKGEHCETQIHDNCLCPSVENNNNTGRYTEVIFGLFKESACRIVVCNTHFAILRLFQRSGTNLF